MNKTLRILAWNANGLLQQLPELEIFLNTEKVDICLIAESHFTRNSYARIRGYCSYHSIHPAEKARGGATIFIRENIKHFEDVKLEIETMQIVSLSVQLNNYKMLRVAAIYCPPRHQLKKDDYVSMLRMMGSSFVIGGDFNAKHTHWGSRLISPKGRELLKAGHQINCEFHSSGIPTYWPTDTNKIPDVVDFFIAKGISENYIHIENNEGLSSDHSPIILTISETVIEKEKPPRLTSGKTNWETFALIIEESIDLQAPMKNKTQLEHEVELLINNIQIAAWESTPAAKNEPYRNETYTQEIRNLVREKRKARKIWHRTRAPESKTVFNHLKNKLKKLIQETKCMSLNKYLRGLSGHKESDYSLWKATKGLKRPKEQMPPIKKVDGTWARSPKDKADIFAEHLEETFQPLPRQTAIENTFLTQKEDELDIRPVTLKELKNEIKHNLNAKKSPGYDLITGKIIKSLPEKCLKKLLHIINAAFRMKHVPQQWKIAEVIMIPKPNKPPNEKTSYRPISVLPSLSKLFEKLLLKRMKPLIEERHLLPSHQFGFREKHSTIEQVHRVTNVIEKTLENKKICSGIFLDVAQAFDRVWHRGLEYKLHRDLPKQFYQILKSYIEGRYFRVKFEGEFSSLKRIEAGVPQGSVLGPILYLLYTRDIPITGETDIATFADDTAMLAVGSTIEESTRKLQQTLDGFVDWTKKWRIKLNELKSTHTTFTYLKVDHLPIYINRQEIPHANTAKYLGMTLDAKLKWKEHVKKKKQELDIKFRKMYWLIGRNSELTTHNKLLLYRQILKPVWTYGIELWGCTKKTNVTTIQTFQNKVLRCIVDAPWYIRNDNLHRDLKMETVYEETTKNAKKYIQRLQLHENMDIQRIVNDVDSADTRRLKRTKPLDLVAQD